MSQLLAQEMYLDHDTAAAHDLTGFALAVDLAKTDPFAKLLVVINLVHDKGENGQSMYISHLK